MIIITRGDRCSRSAHWEYTGAHHRHANKESTFMPPEIPLRVVRRGIVMDQTQTLPPPQAVLKMAGEFILDSLMDIEAQHLVVIKTLL